MKFNDEISKLFHDNINNKKFIELLNMMLNNRSYETIVSQNYPVELVTDAYKCFDILRTRNTYMSYNTKRDFSSYTQVSMSDTNDNEYILHEVPSFYKDSGLPQTCINSQSRRRLQATSATATSIKTLADDSFSLAIFTNFINEAYSSTPMSGTKGLRYLEQVSRFKNHRSEYITLIVNNCNQTKGVRNWLRVFVKNIVDSAHGHNSMNNTSLLLQFATITNKH